MLDVYSDMTQLAAACGCQFEMVEMCEVQRRRQAVSEDQIQEKLKEFRETFAVAPACSEYELRCAAQTACALDEVVQAHRLGALAYYYEGSRGNEYENIVTPVIAGNTLLTGKHVPATSE